jgi:hypothetical protein
MIGFATNVNLARNFKSSVLSASSYVVILSHLIMTGLGMLLSYLSTVAETRDQPFGLYNYMATPREFNAYKTMVLIVFLLMTIDCNTIIFLPFQKSNITEFFNGFPKIWLVIFCNAASLFSSIASCASAIAAYYIPVNLGGGASISSTLSLIASIALLLYNIIKCWLLWQSFSIFNQKQNLASHSGMIGLSSDHAQSENSVDEGEIEIANIYNIGLYVFYVLLTFIIHVGR